MSCIAGPSRQAIANGVPSSSASMTRAALRASASSSSPTHLRRMSSSSFAQAAQRSPYPAAAATTSSAKSYSTSRLSSRPFLPPRSLSNASLSKGGRNLHSLAPLPEAIADAEQGCKPFLSAETIQLIGNVWQGGLLQRLNDEVRGTHFETSSVADTVVGTALDRKMILAFNYASQALNNSFFLSNLRSGNDSKPNPLPPKSLLSRIEEDFGSLPAFKSAFSAAALGMVSSGWLWLVRDQTGRLGIVPTFGAGTVLVQDRMQRGNRDFQASIEESMSRAERTQRKASGEAPSSGGESSTTSSPQTPGNQRSFSTSATASANYAPPGSRTTGVSSLTQLYGSSSNRMTGAHGKAQIGQQLTPLLVLSVQEHAWLPDYGMWGKEMYLMNFWECVNWEKVGRVYDAYASGQMK